MEAVQKILNQYDIPEVSPIEMVRESGDNHVYLIGEKNKKILRVSKRLPIEDVRFEYETLRYLSSNDFPVPDWIKTRDGNFYASTDEFEVAVMFNFLEGYHTRIDKDNLPTKEQAYTAGRALAFIAEVGKTFKKELEGGEVFVEQVKEAIKFGCRKWKRVWGACLPQAGNPPLAPLFVLWEFLWSKKQESIH